MVKMAWQHDSNASRHTRKWQMAAFQEEWLKEMTVLPEGNQAGSAGWAATIREVSPTHIMAISHSLRRVIL